MSAEIDEEIYFFRVLLVRIRICDNDLQVIYLNIKSLKVKLIHLVIIDEFCEIFKEKTFRLDKKIPLQLIAV